MLGSALGYFDNDIGRVYDSLIDTVHLVAGHDHILLAYDWHKLVKRYRIMCLLKHAHRPSAGL